MSLWSHGPKVSSGRCNNQKLNWQIVIDLKSCQTFLLRWWKNLPQLRAIIPRSSGLRKLAPTATNPSTSTCVFRFELLKEFLINDEMPFSCIRCSCQTAAILVFLSAMSLLGEVFKWRAPLNRISAAWCFSSISWCPDFFLSISGGTGTPRTTFTLKCLCLISRTSILELKLAGTWWCWLWGAIIMFEYVFIQMHVFCFALINLSGNMWMGSKSHRKEGHILTNRWVHWIFPLIFSLYIWSFQQTSILACIDPTPFNPVCCSSEKIPKWESTRCTNTPSRRVALAGLYT